MLVLLLQDRLVCAIRGGGVSIYSHGGYIVLPFSINTSLYVIVLIGCNSMLGFFCFFFHLKKHHMGRYHLQLGVL